MFLPTRVPATGVSIDLSRRRFVAAAGLAGAGLAGCLGGERDVTAELEESHDVDGVDALAIHGMAVSVTAEERSDVHVAGTKRAANEGDLEDVSLVSEREGATLVLRVERDGGDLVRLDPAPTMSLSVRVPRTLALEFVESTNGDVGVESVAGGVEVDSTNGSVRAVDVHGPLTVEHTNGDVSVDGVAGSLDVDLTNGDVSVAGVAGDVDVGVTNGDVEVTLAAPPDVRLDLSTDNGSLTIDVPGVAADGDALTATVGGGRRRVAVATTNGDVVVRTAA